MKNFGAYQKIGIWEKKRDKKTSSPVNEGGRRGQEDTREVCEKKNCLGKGKEPNQEGRYS